MTADRSEATPSLAERLAREAANHCWFSSFRGQYEEIIAAAIRAALDEAARVAWRAGCRCGRSPEAAITDHDEACAFRIAAAIEALK